MTTRQKDHEKIDGEAEAQGSRKGIARVEGTTQGRTRVAQKREGSVAGTRVAGGKTCRLVQMHLYRLLIHLNSWHIAEKVSSRKRRILLRRLNRSWNKWTWMWFSHS